METYEQQKELLADYISALDEKCAKNFGPMNRIRLSSSNPFKKYRSIKKFVEDTGYDQKTILKPSDCKFVSGTAPTKYDTDRYFSHRNKRDCDLLNGSWDYMQRNRVNKYTKGVCWKSNDSHRCGTRINDPRVIRPSHVKFNPEIETIVEKERVRCEKEPKCSFDQVSAFSYDCVPKKNTSVKEFHDPNLPPKDMPLENFEKYLENWYINGKPHKAPPTGKLIGKGDRCKAAIVEQDAMNNNNKPVYIDFRKLDPKDPKNEQLYRKYLDDKKFDLLKKYPKFEDIYEYIDFLQYDTDYDVHDVSQQPTTKMTLSLSQSIINQVMKNHAIHDSKKRGMLVWHSTGAGKTAVATGIMDAFWDTNKTIVFLSSVDAIASNPDFVFHKYAYNLYPRFHAMGEEEHIALANIATEFKNRNVRFLTFAKLANRLEKGHKDFIDLDKCVLIIDEVHNLFRPLANQKKQHAIVENHLVNKKFKNMKVIILTATPGDNIPDVMKLINIVRDYNTDVITAPDANNAASIKEFKNRIRGMISYLDLSNDSTKFPSIERDTVKVPISKNQLEKYLDAYNKVNESQKNYSKLAKANALDRYWAPARKYANMLFSFEKNMNLNDFSSKIPAFLKLLKEKSNDKHYLYSSFYTKNGYGGHGVVGIAKTLEKEGYERLTYQKAKEYNKKGKLPSPKKRYILVTNTELGEKAGENLHELLKIYNHADNKDGQLIHVMLASNKYNESIDLKDVSHIHIFEPLVTMAAEKQAIGRAVRFCSFANKDRSKGEWKVIVHNYMLDSPKNLPVTKNIDEFIFQESRAHFKDLFTVYQCMKFAAFDCRLLKEFHESTGSEIMQCEF